MTTHKPNLGDRRYGLALCQLQCARYSWNYERYPSLIKRLVPAAEIVAAAEGHDDAKLVLARELNLR